MIVIVEAVIPVRHSSTIYRLSVFIRLLAPGYRGLIMIIVRRPLISLHSLSYTHMFLYVCILKSMIHPFIKLLISSPI